jgi:hypothetical protein
VKGSRLEKETRAMKKKRNRSRPALPLQERLKQLAFRAREKAEALPPGRERDRLLTAAVSTESAAAIERWLTSRELESPK